MTPDDDAVLAVLDERGRAAAAALREHVDRTSGRAQLPAAGGREARGPGRRAPLVAAAATIVVLVGTVIALAGQDEASTVAGGVADEMVAGWLPEGMETSAAQRVGGDEGGPEPVAGFVVAYGDGSIEDPWAGATLSVSSVDVAPDAEAGERITVGGHDAVVEEADGVTVSWGTDGGRIVVRGSAGVDRATVVAAAEGVDGSPAIASDALPAGFVEIGRGSLDAMMGAGGPGYLGRGTGLVLAYTSGDPSEPEAVVSVFQRPGDEDAVDLVRLTSAVTRSDEVRGHHAVVGDGGSGSETPEPFAQWREPSGLVTTVSGVGVDEATLLRIAGGLRPAEPGEIDGLVERTRPEATSSPSEGGGSAAARTTADVVVATGDHEGAPWRLAVTERAGLQRIELSYRESVVSTGWPAGDVAPPLLTGSSHGATWTSPVVFGLVHTGSRVTVEVPGREPIVPQLTSVRDEDLLGFVVFLPSDTEDGAEYTVVVTDGAGVEVARETQPIVTG